MVATHSDLETPRTEIARAMDSERRAHDEAAEGFGEPDRKGIVIRLPRARAQQLPQYGSDKLFVSERCLP
jgi:hypothetical protein